MRNVKIFVIAAVAGLNALMAYGDCAKAHTFVVVFDLNAVDAANDDFGDARQRVYSFPVQADPKLATEIADHAAWKAIAKRLAAHGMSARWIGTRGDVVRVFAYGSRQQISEVQFRFDETPRLSRLSSDLIDLIRIAAAIGVTAENRADEDEAVWSGCHELGLRRSDLTVKAIAAKVPPKPADDAQQKEPVKTTFWPAVFSVKTVNGPREALFLSADVALTKASQLKLNDAGTDVTLRDEQTTFYAGVNYTFGDVLSEPERFLRSVVLKGMVKAGRAPWSSYGWAVGLRSIDLDWLGIHLDAITPFAGYTYTREDAPPGQTKRGRNSEFRLGVSLNLSSAVKWIKPDAKK